MVFYIFNKNSEKKHLVDMISLSGLKETYEILEWLFKYSYQGFEDNLGSCLVKIIFDEQGNVILCDSIPEKLANSFKRIYKFEMRGIKEFEFSFKN